MPYFRRFSSVSVERTGVLGWDLRVALVAARQRVATAILLHAAWIGRWP